MAMMPGCQALSKWNSNQWANSSLAEEGIFTTPAERELLSLHSKALGQPSQQACESFRSLATSADYPLQNLAELRALIVCPESTALPFLESLQSKDSKDFLEGRSFMGVLFWTAKLRVALQATSPQGLNPQGAANAYVQLARLSDQIPEKRDLYLKALELGKLHKNKITAETLAAARTGLYAVAPRFDPQPKREKFLAVGKDWIAAREFQKGRTYLAPIIKKPLSFTESIQARIELRQSYKNEGEPEKHVAESRKLAQWLKSNKEWARALDASLFWARAVWTQGNTDLAERMLRSFYNEYSKIPSVKQNTGEIFWLLGRIADERKNYPQAVAEFARATEILPEKHKLLRAAKSHMAWMHRKNQDFTSAAKIYQELSADTQESDRNRLLYWLGKSLLQGQKNQEARAVFETLIKSDPLGYYGLLAHRELGWSLPPIAASGASTKQQDGSVSGDWIGHEQIPAESARWIDLLWRSGEKEILGKYLDSQSNNKSPGAVLFLIKAYARAGLYNNLFREIGKLETGIREKILNDFPALLFPLDYSETIDKAAQQFRVPAELVFAIIRQESAFQPTARSPADAFGLMQILPSVAAAQGRKYSIPFGNFEDLYNPEINIPLGTSLLADLLRKYHGNFFLVAAAYNASEKAIQRWMNHRFTGDVIEFIEDIPYAETQTYVKLILRNSIFYQRLKEPTKPLAVPDSLFTLATKSN